MSWCETEMQKYMPLVKQNVMKFEVFILGGQRINQKDGGEGVERGLRWKQREDKDREKRDKEDKEHRHLPLLVVPQGTTFILSSRLVQQ